MVTDRSSINLDKIPDAGGAQSPPYGAIGTKQDQANWNTSNKLARSRDHQVITDLGLSNFAVDQPPIAKKSFQTADLRPDPSDRSSKQTSDSAKPSQTLEASREFLQQTAKKELSKEDSAQLIKDMDTFEKRAGFRKLPNSEVARTYDSVRSLLTAKYGTVDVADRQRLAEQVMSQAADPSTIRQGSFNTCGAASVENLIYTSTPSAAADLVAQSALTGKYSNNGVEVQANAKPSYSSSSENSNDPRSYASEVFQEVAVNVGFKAMKEDQTYSFNREKPEKPDAKNPLEIVTDGKGKKSNFEGLTPSELVDAYAYITGKVDLNIVLSGDGRSTSNVKFANTPEEMKTALKDLTSREVPTIALVDSRSQPLWNEQNGGMPPAETPNPNGNYKHFVSVTGYDAKDGVAYIHTNWFDGDSKFSAKELSRAVRDVDKNLTDMDRDFAESRARGKPDYAEAIDALRIRAETGRISTSDLKDLLKRDLKGLAASGRDKICLNAPTLSNSALELMAYLKKRHQPLTVSTKIRDYLSLNVPRIEVPGGSVETR